MKKNLILIPLMILLIGVGILGYRWWQNSQWQPYTLDELKVNFLLHDSLKPGNLSDEDKGNSILFRVKEEGDQPMLITFRHEDGLRSIAALTRQDVVPMLVNNATKSLPNRYPEFETQTPRQFELSGHEAAEFVFTYRGNNGERAKQRFLILDIDGNRVLYVSAQAKASDFDKLNQQYFNRIFVSFKFD